MVEFWLLKISKSIWFALLIICFNLTFWLHFRQPKKKGVTLPPLLSPGKSDSSYLCGKWTHSMFICEHIHIFTHICHKKFLWEDGWRCCFHLCLPWVMVVPWCVLLSKSFLWDWIKERAFCRFFGPKERNLLYYIAWVVKEMEKLDGFWHEKKSTTKRNGEIGWILTWEKINH